MLRMTPAGLYCEVGDFYIDPRRRVSRAVITHAHSDHARPGMQHYLAHPHTAALMRARLGAKRSIEELPYGHTVNMNGVQVSFHPAGHVAGSSQVRLEHGGEVWVATGDYKREGDAVSAPFEVVPCSTLITECTFGLPVYRWPSPALTRNEIHAWWRSNAEHGMLSVLRGYSLGKAQRILAELDPSIGPIYVSAPVAAMNAVLRTLGYALPETQVLPGTANTPHDLPPNALVITSTAVTTTRDIPQQAADASGWLAVQRHRRSRQQGFVMSDHADWPSLLQTIRECGATQVFTMHGFTAPLARYLREQGLDAHALEGGEGRTASLQMDLTTARAAQLRSEVCQEAQIPAWLFDECVGHTRSVSETAALIRTGTYQPQRRTQSTRPTVQQPVTPLGATIDVVLYHLHRRPGSRSIHQFTMAVWHQDHLIPLAHVPARVDRELLRTIVDFAESHTTVHVGPVRTIEPHFVFTIAASSLSAAPRRKVGIHLHDAQIVAFHRDRDPSTAHSLQDVQELVKGASA